VNPQRKIRIINPHFTRFNIRRSAGPQILILPQAQHNTISCRICQRVIVSANCPVKYSDRSPWKYL